MSLATLTPGPLMWKLCSAERSCTSSVYAPGSRWLTFVPLASLRLIVKPGPTEPTSWPSAAAEVRPKTGATATRHAATVAMRAIRMPFLRGCRRIRFSRHMDPAAPPVHGHRRTTLPSPHNDRGPREARRYRGPRGTSLTHLRPRGQRNEALTSHRLYRACAAENDDS